MVAKVVNKNGVPTLVVGDFEFAKRDIGGFGVVEQPEHSYARIVVRSGEVKIGTTGSTWDLEDAKGFIKELETLVSVVEAVNTFLGTDDGKAFLDAGVKDSKKQLVFPRWFR